VLDILYIFITIKSNLLPPRSLTRAEIGFRPRFKDDISVGVLLAMSKGKRQRSGATNNLALLVILRSMARAPIHVNLTMIIRHIIRRERS
jgi:hypothetical protein